MIVYLVRHGQAEDQAASGLDRDRRLTHAGRERMQVIGRGLSRLDIQPDQILTSPFPRASETAQIIAAALGRLELLQEVEALGCGNGGEHQIRAMLNPTWHEVMIVGHEPELTAITEALAGAGTNVRFKKGGVCRIDLAHPMAQGEMIWLLAPRVLTALGE